MRITKLKSKNKDKGVHFRNIINIFKSLKQLNSHSKKVQQCYEILSVSEVHN